VCYDSASSEETAKAGGLAYYAFGMTYEGSWQVNDVAKDNPYQYNGKELNVDHGLNWSDYGARFYDACVGRWSSVDPLAEVNPDWNPYRYGFNNPLTYTDPTGMIEGHGLGGGNRHKQASEEALNLGINRPKDKDDDNSENASSSSTSDNKDCPCGTRGCRPCADKFERVENAIQTMSSEERALAFELQFSAATLYVPVASGIKLLSSIRWLRWGKVAKGGIANSKAMGNAMEQALGMAGPKAAINVGGRTRFPDRLDLLSGVLEESKNVKHLNFTGQLRDYLNYSQSNGIQMILHTRPNTTFSKPLQQLINNGTIIHNKVPGF
jgi:RHS repeat-associated protein